MRHSCIEMGFIADQLFDCHVRHDLNVVVESKSIDLIEKCRIRKFIRQGMFKLKVNVKKILLLTVDASQYMTRSSNTVHSRNTGNPTSVRVTNICCQLSRYDHSSPKSNQQSARLPKYVHYSCRLVRGEIRTRKRVCCHSSLALAHP